MNSRLNTIIALFEDHNIFKLSATEREDVFARWVKLAPDDREFLEKLSVENLSSICTGETRYGENDEILWVIDGVWQTLPPGVDQFLNSVSEMTS